METESKALKISGYVWHMYHSYLLTYCWDYDWRVEDIKLCKPRDEVPTRLKRFQLVKGTLPDAFNETRDGSQISRLAEEYKEVIEALHREECKNCTWNGKELVFPKSRIHRVLKWAHRLLGG